MLLQQQQNRIPNISTEYVSLAVNEPQGLNAYDEHYNNLTLAASQSN
jgi:hypothetical protein